MPGMAAGRRLPLLDSVALGMATLAICHRNPRKLSTAAITTITPINQKM
jgi:hypothetical protein